MPFDEIRKIASPTGATLNLHIKRAVEKPRGVVQINHGFAEHSARYARFADFLAGHGFHTYAHDHRGHGATKAPDAPIGRLAATGGAERVIEDVLAIHDLIAQENPGLPVIVFGHSMGGLIALNFVLRHPKRVDAAAIWNANFSAGLLGHAARLILRYERFRMGADVPSRLIPKLTFRDWSRKIPDRKTDADWLSRDEQEVAAYVADPLSGWDGSVSMWLDVFDFIFYGADDRNFANVRKDLPFSLVGGEKDPATNNGKAVQELASRMRRMGFSNLVSTIYPQTRHESLNELNRNIIMQDFVDWAVRVLPGTEVRR
ncbi:alpha/beta hydrolase [Mesorhizobium sp. SB112]|uniref:alpha/beta hydrolase n=1 Tax=Mesorhizobium sp. SB112 TaxID=3151853 RepID=UPI0032664D34